MGNSLEIFVDGEQIILKKYKPNMSCVITGKISDYNLPLAEGKLILSREGEEKLLQEIQQSFELAK